MSNKFPLLYFYYLSTFHRVENTRLWVFCCCRLLKREKKAKSEMKTFPIYFQLLTWRWKIFIRNFYFHWGFIFMFETLKDVHLHCTIKKNFFFHPRLLPFFYVLMLANERKKFQIYFANFSSSPILDWWKLKLNVFFCTFHVESKRSWFFIFYLNFMKNIFLALLVFYMNENLLQENFLRACCSLLCCKIASRNVVFFFVTA